MSLRSTLSYIGLAIGSIGIIALLLFQIVPLLSGPRLTISSPIEYTTRDSFLEIAGSTVRAVSITINDNRVVLHEDTTFIFPTIVLDGLNEFTLIAKDKFGRTTTKTLQIMKEINPV